MLSYLVLPAATRNSMALRARLISACRSAFFNDTGVGSLCTLRGDVLAARSACALTRAGARYAPSPLPKLAPEKLGQHRHDAVVREEAVVHAQQLALGLKLLELGPQLGQAQHLPTAPGQICVHGQTGGG